ncbi:MAG: TIGR00282 family metallophosphoesterase [Bacteroidota bacterium]|jgi:metallophosphoesterase (TIGR00282 family)|nr:TIGR00282 family metallophosphoesterase [Bacteroidota bacterium]
MSLIKILFIGDIVGNAGLNAVRLFLPALKQKHDIACVIVNGENAMEGKSISEQQYRELLELGVHVITSGNHIWEKWHIQKLLATEQNLLRPANYPRDNAGRGFTVVPIGAAGSVGVLNIQGRTFMSPIDCPFRTAEWAVERLREHTPIILVDIHAEATAEKIAMGWFLDGRVSAVVGTHTHIQTADAKILPGGTAFITDVGMTGPYDSVVGMRKDIALRRFIKQTPHKFEMATDDVHLSAVLITVDIASGKARSIEPLTLPEFSRHAE